MVLSFAVFTQNQSKNEVVTRHDQEHNVLHIFEVITESGDHWLHERIHGRNETADWLHEEGRRPFAAVVNSTNSFGTLGHLGGATSIIGAAVPLPAACPGRAALG